jgi:hypothetical protein
MCYKVIVNNFPSINKKSLPDGPRDSNLLQNALSGLAIRAKAPFSGRKQLNLLPIHSQTNRQAVSSTQTGEPQPSSMRNKVGDSCKSPRTLAISPLFKRETYAPSNSILGSPADRSASHLDTRLVESWRDFLPARVFESRQPFQGAIPLPFNPHSFR